MTLLFLAGCGQRDNPQDARTDAAPADASTDPAVTPSPPAGPAAACAPPSTDAPEPCNDTGPVVPYEPATAPAAFASRADLHSCGSYGLGPRPLPPAVFECFAARRSAGTGAELAVADMTTEGDTVVRYYRSVPGSTDVEVFIDATRDQFGSGEWIQDTCTGYDTATGQATGCSPDGTGQI